MPSYSSTPPLPAGIGYGVVLGLGFLFALIMNGITWIQTKFSQFSPSSAAEFTAASRSVKTGLVVAGILSSCELYHLLTLNNYRASPILGTWSLTLLQSATQSYNMGISGGYWYAVGGTLQIAVFSVIASKVKMNANRATTFPEVSLSVLIRTSHIEHDSGRLYSFWSSRPPCFPLVRSGL
jgi:urea-proton symporter